VDSASFNIRHKTGIAVSLDNCDGVRAAIIEAAAANADFARNFSDQSSRDESALKAMMCARLGVAIAHRVTFHTRHESDAHR
jgi:hypothetical protein